LSFVDGGAWATADWAE